jgi:XK-related protein
MSVMNRPKWPKTRRSELVDDKPGTVVDSGGDAIELQGVEGLEDEVEGIDGLVVVKPGKDESNLIANECVAESDEPSVTEDNAHGSENEHLYSYVEILWTVMSIVSYVVDVGSDIYVAVIYYVDQEWWWFGLTSVFIVVPSLTISAFSFVWYLEDRIMPVVLHPVRFIPRLVLVSLQLGPLIRLVQKFKFGSLCLKLWLNGSYLHHIHTQNY